MELGKANSDLQPCIPASKPSDAEKQLTGYREGGACSAQAEEAAGSEENPATETICPACYLLGAQGLVGFVRVPFLVASISQEELVGIGIDRARGVVRGGAKWTYEFAPPSTEFTGVLELLVEDPVRSWVLGRPRPGFEKQDQWLANGEWSQERIQRELIHQRLEAIDVLGAFKSKGFGRVKITVTPLDTA